MPIFTYDAFTGTNGDPLTGVGAHVGETGATWTKTPGFASSAGKIIL